MNMRRTFLLVLIIILPIITYGQLNMTKLTFANYNVLHGTRLNDVWGYVDETGIEYALVGAKDGVSIMSLEDPYNPVEKLWLAGDESPWRDLKTHGDFLYVTTEAKSGLLIVDLSPLPNGEITNYTYYKGPSGFSWESAHNLYIDEDGFAYIFGANRGKGGVIILDVATDPMNPIEVGVFDEWYVHDGYVRDNLMYLAHIYEGLISIVDISIKNAPVLLGTANTPSNFAHNIWPSDDGNFAFTTDEVSGGYLAAFDVSDPANIIEVGRIQSSPGKGIVPHNVHVYLNWLVTSYYTDGVTVHDISRPHNMIEVGNFDTTPLQSIYTQGCWGAYPFLPSGLILATDIEEGLFILQPDYKKGSYLEGVVTNAETGDELQGVHVAIHNHDQVAISNTLGMYATGIVGEGDFEVTFSKTAFYSKTFTVNLSEGNVFELNTELEPMPPFAFKLNVIDQENGNPIVAGQVELSVPEITHEFSTNGLGEANVTLFYKGEYELIVGKWGYVTSCEQIEINEATGEYTIALTKGYYDDFTFDFGWSTTSNAESGKWIRATPNPTETLSNPDSDVLFDCGDKAFVTGNEGINPNTDNVTNGTVVLISPVFDISSISDPYINYWTYFCNESGPFPPDDTLRIVLSNGFVTALIDYEAYPESIMKEWVPKSIRIRDYMNPTANMQLFISISDYFETRNITEAGFDYFTITPASILDLVESTKTFVTVYPNPTSEKLYIEKGKETQLSQVEITNTLGQQVFLSHENLEFIDVANYPPGIYNVKIQNDNNEVFMIRFIKQ